MISIEPLQKIVHNLWLVWAGFCHCQRNASVGDPLRVNTTGNEKGPHGVILLRWCANALTATHLNSAHGTETAHSGLFFLASNFPTCSLLARSKDEFNFNEVLEMRKYEAILKPK